MHLRALAVFAHPDDATWLAGGTLARLAACGADVRLLCLTCGGAGRTDDADAARHAGAAAVEQRELETSCRMLGIRRPIMGGCRPGAVATECRQAIEFGISRALATLRPHVVITFGPDGVTGDPDHVAVGEITTAAFHRVFGETETAAVGARLYYALGSAAMRRARPVAVAGDGLRVTTVVDVTPVAARKLAALEEQRTSAQARPGDVAANGLTLAVSEQFHRAAPVWTGGVMESALEDVIPGAPCRALTRPERRRPQPHGASLQAAA
jgi:N-acetylglucosamine malate deacetylase 2